MFFFNKRKASAISRTFPTPAGPPGNWPPAFQATPFELVGAPVIVEVDKRKDPRFVRRVTLEEARTMSEVVYRAEGFEMEIRRV